MTKRTTYHIPNLGTCQIDYYDEVVIGLQLNNNSDIVTSCEPSPFSDMVFKQIIEYLEGSRKSFDINIDISNITPFGQRVLSELQTIPYGELRSYKQIAEAIGNPCAARAVGGACNKNPIHIIIPCHRVVGAKNKLTGYAAGLETKKQLLETEGIQTVYK